MAPEVVRALETPSGEVVGKTTATDIYAFGLVIYQVPIIILLSFKIVRNS